MAILDDDFQGYAIGTSLPFGSWIGSGFADSIVSEPGGTGIPGTDRAFNLFLGQAEYVNASYLSSFSQFISVKLGDSQNTQTTLGFANGPNGSGHTFTLLSLRIEPDSTITAVCTASGEILANSGDLWFRFGTYNFFQVNVILSDVLVSGVLNVNIECHVALNGVEVLSFNTTVNMAVSSLTNGTAEVNRFDLLGGTYGAYMLDTLQPIVTYPHGGTPDAQAFQAVVEVDELLDSGVLDAYQAVVEVDVLPDTAELIVYQMVIEVDVLQKQGIRADYIHRRHFPGD
jgi:hypothetical protein